MHCSICGANDWPRLAYLTVGIDAAHARTRIDAVPVTAGLIATAFRMVEALGPPTLDERIAAVAGRAGTDRAAAGRFLARGAYPARIARTSLPYKETRAVEVEKDGWGVSVVMQSRLIWKYGYRRSPRYTVPLIRGFGDTQFSKFDNFLSKLY